MPAIAPRVDAQRPARALVFAGLLALISAPLAGRQAPQTPPPQGVVVGQVVDAATGAAIPNATVNVLGAVVFDGGQPRPSVVIPGGPMRALTNGEGRFVFRPIGKGTYSLTATASSYVLAQFGQSRPNGPSRELVIDDSSATTMVTLKMWRQASISGTVFEENGEPAVGVSVRALRLVWSSGRRKYIFSTGGTQTDDRGGYRISPLVPGEYVVVAPFSVTNVPTSTVDVYQDAMVKTGGFDMWTELQQLGPPFTGGIRVGDQQLQMPNGGRSVVRAADGSQQFLSYQTAFPGSAASLAQAPVITLASGEQRSSTDIHLRLVHTVRVSGEARTSKGPVSFVNVRLVPGGDAAEMLPDSALDVALTQTDADGRFTFLAVPSGQYVLKIQTIPSTRDWDGSLMFPDPVLSAAQPVTVGDVDLVDVSATVRAGSFIRGRVNFDSHGAPRPLPDLITRMAVSVLPPDRAGPLTNFPVSVSEDGSFVTPSYAPGRYLLQIFPPGAPWTLSSATVGGRDVAVDAFELGLDNIDDLVVTFADQTTELSGSVRDAGSGVVEAVVYVFPFDTQAWMSAGMSTRKSRSASVARTGLFTIRDLPPGDYQMVAMAPDVDVDLQDPRWIARLGSQSTRISLRLGDKKRQDLELSRVR